MTQFVFRRRDIQIWLDELCDHLPVEEIESLATRLNSGDRLETMWEVALLKAIVHETDFAHEAPLENGRKPDFKFTLNVEGQSLDIYGDVTALSDDGIDAQNPVGYFLEEMSKQREKHGLLDMSLDTQFQSNRSEQGLRDKTILSLPPKGEIPNIIRTVVIPILRTWKQGEIFGETREINERGLSMSITRKPDSPYSSAGYAGYQNVGKAEDSPLYKKLKTKKSQLSGVSDDSLNILVICDGGSHVIKPSLQYSPFTVDLEDICSAFLRSSRSLDMILMIAVNTLPPRPFMAGGFDKEIRATFVCQQDDRRKDVMTNAAIEAVIDAANHWVSALPLPIMSPSNAKRRLKDAYGPTLRGGGKMSGNKFHLPSRRVTELLAGISSPEEWSNDYEGTGVNPTSGIARMLLEGRMITSVEVEKRDDADDDWLIITFGEPDAAFSKFKAKAKTNASKA